MPTPIRNKGRKGKTPVAATPPSSPGKPAGTSTPPAEKPLSYSLNLARSSYIPTPATPGGSGWSFRFAAGKVYADAAILPTFAIGGSESTTRGKLLASGTENLSNTSIPGSTFLAHAGMTDLRHSPIGSENTRWVTASTTQLGIGQYTVSDVGWQLFAIQKETHGGIAFNLWGLYLQPFAGFSLESALPINKPEDQSTLRDYGRRLAVTLGIDLTLGNMPGREAEQATLSPLQRFHYYYSDLMTGIATWVDYKSMDRDVATTQTAIEKMIGPQEESAEPSAKSELPTLLLSGHFFASQTAGKNRGLFCKLGKDSQKTALWYHLVRTGAFAVIAVSAERPDVLAPAALSSARNLIDLWALRHSDGPAQAMTYHLLIGGGMMALGALANDSPYGKALSLAGMEGIAATAFSPDPRGSRKWIAATRYEYMLASSYSRSGGVADISGQSRPSLRVETAFQDSSLFIANTASTPMADIRSMGGRSASFATDREGIEKYANTKVDISSAMVTTVGLHGFAGDKGSAVSLRGYIGVGPGIEWSGSGVEAGATAEIGAGIDIHPSGFWSVGLSARCSATRFFNGYDTNCGIGLGLSLGENRQ